MSMENEIAHWKTVADEARERATDNPDVSDVCLILSDCCNIIAGCLGMINGIINRCQCEKCNKEIET